MKETEPLASRTRPTTLDDVVGQEHLVGDGKPLREAITKKHLFSFILWGPPGIGKTQLVYSLVCERMIYELEKEFKKSQHQIVIKKN